MNQAERLCGDERGATATLVALSLFFLIAAAALAVDISAFYGDARSNQTSADLACLAGVAELPDQTAAINSAAANAKINFPQMSGGGRSSRSPPPPPPSTTARAVPSVSRPTTEAIRPRCEWSCQRPAMLSSARCSERTR